jgi:hypothetical protein
MFRPLTGSSSGVYTVLTAELQSEIHTKINS